MAVAVNDMILDVQNVSKLFDQTPAVKDVTFQVQRAEVFGLLGPNGAGKTTIANLLIGNYIPDNGEILYYFQGEKVSYPDKRKVGYFPGDSTVFRTLPIGRLLFHTGCKRGMNEEKARAVMLHWLNRLGLAHRMETSLSNLSRGNQQKVQFAEAVLHQPDIVFFDEPFSGLDPVNQELFITMIRELQEEGMTILVADHNMGLVERVANRMLILARGRVMATGTLDDLRAKAQAGIRIRLRLADPRTVIDLSVLAKHPAIRDIERTAAGEIRLMARTGVMPVEVLNHIKTQFRISEILSEPASLHDIYVHLVRQDAEEETETTVPDTLSPFGRKVG